MKGHPTEEKTTFENHTSESGLISKIYNILFSSVQLSHSVMSNSLQPHGLQHTRLICPSPTPRACSNSRPLSRWCPNHIILCHPLLLLPSIFPSIKVFSNESVLPIRWLKYCFSISPSKEYSELISFRNDWFDPLALQRTPIYFHNSTTKKQKKNPQIIWLNWYTGTAQRDGMGREEGGGFGMGSTCIPVADSFWYLAKLIQLCKV